MKILILGGTSFVGRHITEVALGNGHQITLFNRGRTNAQLFPEAEKLQGDRDGGLDALKDKTWDAVVDVNGYVPRIVRESATLLKDAVGQYIFISTGSVYAEPFPAHGDEDAPLKDVSSVDDLEAVSRYYGELKVLCEKAVSEIIPKRTLIQRLGLVAGPYDPTDRATYWAVRAAAGGEMICPGSPDDAFQVVDGRDLANFTIMAVENQYTGIYNTPGESITWQTWLDAAKKISGSNSTYVWIENREFLQRHGLLDTNPRWILPLFLPKSMGDLWTVNDDKAKAIGLTYRSTDEIVKGILDWHKTRASDHTLKAGLSSDDEQDALKAWHHRNS